MFGKLGNMCLILWLIENFVHEVLGNDFLNVTHYSVRRCLSPSINVHDDVTAMWLLWRHWWAACCSSWFTSWLWNVSSYIVRLVCNSHVHGLWTKHGPCWKHCRAMLFANTVREHRSCGQISCNHSWLTNQNIQTSFLRCSSYHEWSYSQWRI